MYKNVTFVTRKNGLTAPIYHTEIIATDQCMLIVLFGVMGQVG